MDMACGVSDCGRGGMKTKLEAARLVTRFGGKVLIANGKIPNVIKEIFQIKKLAQDFCQQKKVFLAKSVGLVMRQTLLEN